MSVAPSIWGPKPAASPPRNEIGPTPGEVEPAKHAGKRTKNSTPAGAGVKREEPYGEVARMADEWKQEGVDPVRRANLELIADFIGRVPLDVPTDVLLRDDTYEVHFSAGAPCLFTVRAFMSPQLATEAVIKARKCVPKAISREKLREVAQAVIQEAREVRTATEEDETRAWVLERLRLDDDLLVADRTDRDGNPDDFQRVRNYIGKDGATVWREGESVLLNLARLIGVLRMDGIRSLSLSQLSARIGRLGFEPVQKGFRAKAGGNAAGATWKRGQVVKARLWEIERDVLVGDADDSDLELIEDEGGEL